MLYLHSKPFNVQEEIDVSNISYKRNYHYWQLHRQNYQHTAWPCIRVLADRRESTDK